MPVLGPRGLVGVITVFRSIPGAGSVFAMAISTSSQAASRADATMHPLLADRERTRGTLTIDIAQMIDEFVWLLEDSADFIAGRVLAAIRRYEAQLLPPYVRVLAEYARLREHSWSAPGHQGGIAKMSWPDFAWPSAAIFSWIPLPWLEM